MIGLCLFLLVSVLSCGQVEPVQAAATSSVSYARTHNGADPRQLSRWFDDLRGNKILPQETMWEYTRRRGSLPQKVDDTGNKVAICTSMRGENSTDIREWVLYYRFATHLFVSGILLLSFALLGVEGSWSTCDT